MGAERLLDCRGSADEINSGVEMTCSRHHSVDDDRGRVITTHGVDGNADLQCLLLNSPMSVILGIAPSWQSGRLIATGWPKASNTSELQCKSYSSSTALTGREL